MRRRLVGISAVVICGACSLVTSLDDLRTNDASTDALGDAQLDASFFDTVVPDGANPGDASDGATDGATDAAPDNFCSTVDATFCDDFDINTNESYFGLALASGNGSSAVNDAEALSAPFALDTYIPSIDGGSARAIVYRSLANPPTFISIDFDARLLTQATRMALATFAFTQSSATWKLELVVDTASLFVRELIPLDGSIGIVPHATIGLAWGNKWRHVTLVWATVGNERQSSLTIDQAPAEQNIPLTTGWPNTNAAISIGIDEVYGPSTPNNVYFDNVVINLQ